MMSGRNSGPPRRPKAPDSKADPLGAVISPGGYFQEGNMVVRRSELQSILHVFGRALEDRRWYRRVWKWLISPFVKPPKPPVLQENRPAQQQARKKFDAAGKAVDLEAPEATIPRTIEIAKR